MDARWTRGLMAALLLVVSMGARSSTPNFTVETSDPKFCAEVARTAERLRRELALSWLGQTMPDWGSPCVMTVQVGANLGAGGATTFVFDRGEVYGWRMSIQGPAERILDSVLPHEITHMVFASYFRCPLPRWADEGGATTVEHASETGKHKKMLVQFLQTGRGIPFNQMFAMTEYPADVMPLYAQGYSTAEFLIESGGRARYLQFLADGLHSRQWDNAVREHYGFKDLGALQVAWVDWVRQGSPKLQPRQDPAKGDPASMMASAAPPPLPRRPQPNLILRLGRNDPSASARTPTGSGRPAAAPVSTGRSLGAAEVSQPPGLVAVLPNSIAGADSSGVEIGGPLVPVAPRSPYPSSPLPTQTAHPQPVVNGR